MNTLPRHLNLSALRTAGLATLGLWLAPAALAQAELPTAQELVARAHEALGWERVATHPGAIRILSDARTRGTEAAQSDVLDGRGRWVQTFEGALPGSSGFDGETTWATDWTHTPLVLELGDRLDAQLGAELLYGSWAAPESGLVFGAVTAEEGAWLIEFASETGYAHGEVRLDDSTSLPHSVSWSNSGAISDWTFEEFEDHDGYRFPARVSVEQSGQVERMRTREVVFLAESEQDLFAPRLDAPADTHFDAAVSPVLEVRRTRTGHVLVHPLVEGADLGWFIFDTGAGTNCISTAVADRLAGGPFGEVAARGIGGTVPSQFWRADSLQLGPVTIEDPLFVGLDLSFLNQPFGVEVGGIIGYELLARCTVEFDQSAPHIALFEPGSYLLPEESAWEQAILFGRHPCVRAEVEGHEGIFKIDTGAAGDTVTMHAPTVAKLALLEDRKTRSSQAGGVGGSVPTRKGELSSFVLGGHDFGTIPASFAVESEGVFANPYVWGNMGGLLFEPFVLIFDYPSRRIGFVQK